MAIRDQGMAEGAQERRLSRSLGGLLWRPTAHIGELTSIFAIPVAALGFALGFLIVTFNHLPRDKAFTSRPEFFIWAVMIGALVAADLIGFLFALGIQAQLRRNFSISAHWWLHVAYFIFAILIFVGLIAVSVRRGDPTELSDLTSRLRWRTRAVLVISLVAAWPAVTGMWLIQSALFHMRDKVQGRSPSSPGAIVRDLVDARSALSTLVLILGSVVGLAVLATGALRNALLAFMPKAAAEFPITYVVLYGLYFTAIVGLIFVPIYVALQRRASEIINCIYRIPDSGVMEDEMYTGRKNMESILQLGTNIKDALQTGIVILSPLAASLVSTLLPSGKK